MKFNIDIAIVLVYLVATLVIGVWKGKNIKNLKEYAVGDKNFTSLTIISTIFATFVGGSATVGVIEKIHSAGLLFSIIYFGQVILKLIIAYFAVDKVERFKNAISSGEVMEVLYGKEGKIVTGFASVIYSLGIIAAQVTAIGYIFQYYLEMDFITGAIIGAGIVVIYSSFGGIKAVTTTDLFQFAILIIAIPVICNLSLTKIGGYQGLFDSLPHNVLFKQGDTSLLYTNILPLLLFLALSVEPPMIQRILIAKNKAQVKSTMIISSIIEAPFILVIALIGLAGLILYPDVKANLILPHIVQDILPFGIAGLAIAGMLAVIMSTADSYLNTTALALVCDVLKPLLKIKDEYQLSIMRIITLIMGIAAIIVAVQYSSIIDIIMKTSGIWASTVMFPLFMGLLGAQINKKHFMITVYSGALIYLSGILFIESKFSISPLLIGSMTNIVLFLFFYMLNNKNNNYRSSKKKN